MALHDGEEDADSILIDVVHAAIAFGDALTIRYKRVKNKDGHPGLAKTIRDALGEQADDNQLKRLTRLISVKSEIEYSARNVTWDEAAAGLEQLRRFAAWAEQFLRD